MLAAEAAWRDALRAQTLADLVQDGDVLIDERNKEAVAAFVQDSQR